jgi:hypothetical protein
VKNLAQAKKFVLTLTALAVIPTLTGCTQEQVNAGVGIVAIGAGIAIIAAGASGGGGDQRPDNNRPDRGHDRGPGDFNGGDRGPGRGPRGFDQRNGVNFSNLQMVVATKPAEQTVNVVAFAKVFSISQVSAKLFLTAMEKAKAGDQLALQNLGLTAQDTSALKSFELPSDSSIRLVAKNIQADSGSTRDMIAALLAKAKEQNVQQQIGN